MNKQIFDESKIPVLSVSPLSKIVEDFVLFSTMDISLQWDFPGKSVKLAVSSIGVSSLLTLFGLRSYEKLKCGCAYHVRSTNSKIIVTFSDEFLYANVTHTIAFAMKISVDFRLIGIDSDNDLFVYQIA